MSYVKHLKINWLVAGHALRDFICHFIHGLIPAIEIKHHQPTVIGEYYETNRKRHP